MLHISLTLCEQKFATMDTRAKLGQVSSIPVPRRCRDQRAEPNGMSSAERLRLILSLLGGGIEIYDKETDSPLALKTHQRWFLGTTVVKPSAGEPWPEWRWRNIPHVAYAYRVECTGDGRACACPWSW